MTKLYELTSDIKGLESMDLDEETMSDTLEALAGEFNDKAVEILKFTENMNSDISEIDAEIKRLQSRKKSIENKKSWLRGYLLENMEANGITSIKCPLFSASLRKGAESVCIDSLSLVPDEYVNVEVVEKVDKAAIKRDIKSGKQVPGASIKRGDTTIVIK